MTRRLRLGLGSVSLFTLAGCALAYGCGGGDDASSGDDTVGDAGSDATFDGAPGDAAAHDAAGDDGAVADAGFDAGPAHVVFLTSTGFTGDFVGQANALAADAGVDAGLDGGAEQYLSAGDALCQAAAAKAGLKGTFAVLVSAGTDLVGSRLTDADGPWSLVDGTPVADSAKELASGHWRHAVDMTETGTEEPYDQLKYAWGRGAGGNDCTGWTSASNAVTGGAGSYSLTSHFALANTQRSCDKPMPLYCAQVGAGGGPNRFATIPAGGKRVFFVDRDLPSNFSALASTLVDASIPDAGDALHSNADELCNEAARAAGTPGKYHAWVSSTAVDAKTYFTSHSMNGPFYRVDGAEIAADLTELTTQGIRTQVDTSANGKVAVNLSGLTLTGTKLDGGATDNCQDFVTTAAGQYVRGGRPGYAKLSWSDYNSFVCNSGTVGGLACFEE